jgi:hypothetical protein
MRDVGRSIAYRFGDCGMADRLTRVRPSGRSSEYVRSTSAALLAPKGRQLALSGGFRQSTTSRDPLVAMGASASWSIAILDSTGLSSILHPAKGST